MNTNYNIPQSKLTPHQISAFNKLNPYSFLEKDYSFTPASNMTYHEFFTRYYRNDTGSLAPLKKSDLTSKKFLSKKRNSKNNFHTSCPLTKKKKCWCKFYNDPMEKSLSSFLNKLHNGEIDIDISGENIKIIDNEKHIEQKKKIKNEQGLINEQIKLINFEDVNKDYFTKLNEKNLLVKDYKEIERKINEDKKKCQKCGMSLNGEEQRRGWKNELGEYTLLCISCAKKYYDGAHELRYDSHDNQINYNAPINYNFNNVSNSMKNPNYLQLKNGLKNNNYNGISASHGFKNPEEIYDQTMKNGNNMGQMMDANKPKFVSFQIGKDLANNK